MKKELKAVFITVAILAVLQLVGGTIYTAITAAREKEYTYVSCVVVSVETETATSGEEDQTDSEGVSVTIKSVTVEYENESGEKVTAHLADFPQSFSVGTTLSARYKDDPLNLSTAKTDWFTPVFLLVLGGLYLLTVICMLLFQKRAGLYAIRDAKDDDEELSDEDSDGELNLDVEL